MPRYRSTFSKGTLKQKSRAVSRAKRLAQSKKAYDKSKKAIELVIGRIRKDFESGKGQVQADKVFFYYAIPKQVQDTVNKHPYMKSNRLHVTSRPKGTHSIYD